MDSLKDYLLHLLGHFKVAVDELSTVIDREDLPFPVECRLINGMHQIVPALMQLSDDLHIITTSGWCVCGNNCQSDETSSSGDDLAQAQNLPEQQSPEKPLSLVKKEES